MSTVTEISIPASEFALASTFERVPTAEIEFDRAVARDGTQPLPYLWARGADGDRMIDALRADPTVADTDSLADFGEQGFYLIEWADSTYAAIDHLLEENASILSASGIEGHWTMELLFADRDDLSTFYAACSDDGPSFEVLSIESMDASSWQNRNGLTDKQRTALLAAFDAGYYDVPRAISMSELAEELDVSHQTLSERLRRGTKRLIEDSFGRRSERSEGTE